MKRKLFFIVILFLGVILFFTSLAGTYYTAGINVKNNEYEKMTFIVHEGQSSKQIAKSLKDKGVIKSYWTFLAHLKLSGSKIRGGDYELDKGLSVKDLVVKFSVGEVKVTKVVVPEGWTVEEIIGYLDNENIFKKEDARAAIDKNYNYDFLIGKGIKSFEGYLFPDTYVIDKKASPEDLINMMLKNTESKLSIKGLKDGFGRQGLSVGQAVILASIVEKEGNGNTDRPIIAGILLNRLEYGMRLDADATVRYLTGDWTGEITQKELDEDNPYNTRKNVGLPPTPICNPGLESLNSIAYPEKTDYLYYLHGKDGKARYAKTIEEHNRNIELYLAP
ncbi:MAG: Aminodeoxychorismate lyase [candidate division CPR2 bacterium GW2011_GWC2_39_10]|uniref:Endolytic murein transglycosylase n=1 Tax=candidate division CPR2 bacterium GW2011_GWC2_39_10 TaxID=1618345 RepID=A0A0G0PVM2_UNCC2|nr:MAG: Aminodeoxychorismate lyase [candidate division CPR2 bacterium GW2011_GWC2_39_10]